MINYEHTLIKSKRIKMSQINEGDTVSIKFTSGEEIIARFIYDDGAVVNIQRPMALVNLANGIGLGPFMFTVPKFSELPINKNLVLTMVKTEVEFAKKYAEGTTGLKLS